MAKRTGIVLGACLFAVLCCAKMPAQKWAKAPTASPSLHAPSASAYPDAPAVFLFREASYFMKIGSDEATGAGRLIIRTEPLFRVDVHDAIAILTEKGYE